MESNGKDEGMEEQQSLESSEIEKSKVGIMRALVEREDPSSKHQEMKLDPFLCLGCKRKGNRFLKEGKIRGKVIHPLFFHCIYYSQHIILLHKQLS
ncbi:hypothetical protein RchiOBHm_Chr4g0428821 [Rosa chinensis]|uniref:Uncharacterized protein n=1 Tax=Rosa chinensis TaxID=74649 RepID=A0A2P6R001_ROSCH|nr:hypothetical protein RchiOBHm_Chr4g0428821 [Rosa chinensis]